MGEPIDTLTRLGVTVDSVFVPLSQSRNAKPKKGEKLWQSLNWIVTVKRNGRDVLTTDYSQGIGHCASANSKPSPGRWPFPLSDWKKRAGAWEIESGKIAEGGYRDDSIYGSKRISGPSVADVLYSLVSDAGVLEHSTFENWAAEFGYDTDSRAAEDIYKACLQIALQMRAAFGDDGLRDLQTAFQDY